jgi:hypothetical protein
LKDKIEINQFKKGQKKGEPALIFETSDPSHPEANQIKGKP